MCHIYNTLFGKVVIQEFTHNGEYIGYVGSLLDAQADEIDGTRRILTYAHAKDASREEAKEQRVYLIKKIIDTMISTKKSVSFSDEIQECDVPFKEYYSKAQRNIEWDKFGKFARENGLLEPMNYNDMIEERDLEIKWATRGR